MNYLIDSMMKQTKIQEIRVSASGISNPKDYFSGTPLLPISLPQNIILFHRNKISENQKSAKHHRFLLMINCQGDGDVVVNGTRFQLKVGSGILVFPFQHHHYANQETPMFWLKMTFELASFEEVDILRDRVFEYSEEALEIIFKIVASYHITTFKSSYHTKRLTYLLAALLNEIGQQLSVTPKNNNPKLTELGLVDEINHYIIKNLHTDLSLKSIAKEFHYSESHLRALYRREMDISLGIFIQEIRLHKAQEYLGSTDLPISEIAQLCGFASLYAFSNAFKRNVKISPLSFRRQRITENSK